MKATQNPINCRSIGYLAAAPALASVLGLGTHMAFADTVSLSPNFTALSSNVTFKMGTATLTCTGSSMIGPVPVSTISGPACGAVNAPTFTDCTVSSFGVSFTATVTANGSWRVCLSNSGAGTLAGGTITVTASTLGQTCIIASGAVASNGTWTNGTPTNQSSLMLTNQNVAITTSGGFPCPAGNIASFSSTYGFAVSYNLMIGP